MSVRFAAQNLDDLLQLEIDGEVVCRLEIEAATDQTSGVHLSVRGEGADFDDLQVYRDIYYTASNAKEMPVRIPAGHYYIQLRFILYRYKDGKAYAQAEQFFFGRRALPLLDDISGLTLPVEWPSIPLEELGSYGTVKPNNR